MTFQLVYDYQLTQQGGWVVLVYLKSESAFSLGGFTLRASLLDEGSTAIPVQSISGGSGFVTSSNVATGIASGFSAGGVISTTRNGESGQWVQLAKYALAAEPQGTISVSTQVNPGDFFLANSSDITPSGLSATLTTQSVADADGNGLVDGNSTAIYRIFNGGNPISIRDGAGRNYSDSTTTVWDAIAAAPDPSGAGFQLLLDGPDYREGQFLVWKTDSTGLITASSGWKPAAEAPILGWEQSFSVI